MSRKTLTLIIALTCAVVLALGCFAVQALTAGDKQKTDAPVNFPDSTNVEKANYSSRIQFDDPELLTRSYEKATDAQKQKLDEIQARDTDSLGCFMVCVKDVMLAMGDLPEDTLSHP